MSKPDKHPICRRNQKRFRQITNAGAMNLPDSLKKKIKEWYRTSTIDSNSEEKSERKHSPTEQKYISKFMKKMSFIPGKIRSKKNRKLTGIKEQVLPTREGREKKRTILADNIDLSKGLSDLKIPRCPDFGYPSEVSFDDIIKPSDQKNYWKVMLDLISKFPQLERPKNVLNELKKKKEIVEIENAIVTSLTRKAYRISRLKNAARNMRMNLKKSRESLRNNKMINLGLLNPEEPPTSDKDISEESLSESLSQSRDDILNCTTSLEIPSLGYDRDDSRRQIGLKDTMNPPNYPNIEGKKSLFAGEKFRSQKRKLSVHKLHKISRHCSYF
ncbi:unnamed protein product [Moneuplotes crassus]|uniref:Uncharacterized protein n=1 Tax=Euplotes crassus TaxID=5936 RepID=A0AAD1XZK2_EUPCR|nr:unnamed protein product [Moneuplotes crassus]